MEEKYNEIYDLYTIDDFEKHFPVSQSLVWSQHTLVPEPVTTEQAYEIGEIIGIDFDRIDVEQFRRGLEVEQEHGSWHEETNVTNDDPVMTGRIALAHLLEIPDYYTRLDIMEKEASRYWAERT
jgi:hypothetical protein